MEILVTGASGFVGSRLAKKLAEKHRVTALVHQNDIGNTGGIAETIRVDIRKSGTDLGGPYDIVYHLAGATPLVRDSTVLRETNYDGTVNLLSGLRGGAGVLVYVSGLGVFGDTGGKPFDESAPIAPHTEYADIRAAAQSFLEHECGDKISLITAYLGEVYGDGGWFMDQLVHRMRAGRFRIPGGGKYIRNVIHVDDAVSALIRIGRKDLDGEWYILVDSEPVLFRDFVNHAAKCLGLKPPGGIPKMLAKAVMGSDAIELLTAPTRASNKKISRLMEFRYPDYRSGLDAVLGTSVA